MRFDAPRRPWRRLALLVGALALLRGAILALAALLPPFAEHTQLVAEHELRPAALFYTEVPLALRAEKAVRAARLEIEGRR